MMKKKYINFNIRGGGSKNFGDKEIKSYFLIIQKKSLGTSYHLNTAPSSFATFNYITNIFLHNVSNIK